MYDIMMYHREVRHVTNMVRIDTTFGPMTLRPEQAGDAAFLYSLFRSHMEHELALMPVDDGMRDRIARMQFASQTATYRAHFPKACFDIIEQEGTPIGRLVIDDDGDAACFVDFALVPERRGGGLGPAILRPLLADFGARKRVVENKILCTNEPSLRMCRRLGFVPIGQEGPYLQLEWRAFPPAPGAT